MARKSRTLPFVVQPRLAPITEIIGDEYTGQFEIERRGFLSVAEKAWMQSFDETNDAQASLFSLATRIGSELSMDPRSVFQLIVDSQGQDAKLAPYSMELMEAIRTVGANEERRKFVMASCLISLRVDPKWQIEDTMSLHPDLVDALAAFYIEEEAKTIDALVAATETENPGGEEEKPELGKG